MREHSAGVHRSSDIDGRVVYAGWKAAPTAGWHARVAMPAAPIDSAHRKAIAAALSTSGASLLLGVLLALLVARRVTEPLRQMARQGPGGLPRHIAVREIAALRDALLRARVARFDIDQLLDYRSRRPTMRLTRSESLMFCTSSMGYSTGLRYSIRLAMTTPRRGCTRQ